MIKINDKQALKHNTKVADILRHVVLYCTLFVFRAVFSTFSLTVLSYCMFHLHSKLFTIGQIKMDGWILQITCIFAIHRVSKKLCRFVFVRTYTNFHRF